MRFAAPLTPRRPRTLPAIRRNPASGNGQPVERRGQPAGISREDSRGPAGGRACRAGSGRVVREQYVEPEARRGVGLDPAFPGALVYLGGRASLGAARDLGCGVRRGKGGSRTDRKELMQFGWPSALGLFLSDEADSAALREFAGTRGEKLPPEIRVLQALAEKDTTSARRMLTDAEKNPESVDSSYKSRPMWWSYRTRFWPRPTFSSGTTRRRSSCCVISSRPTLRRATRFPLGPWRESAAAQGSRVRKLGQPQLARTEYKAVLEQWADADSSPAALRPAGSSGITQGRRGRGLASRFKAHRQDGWSRVQAAACCGPGLEESPSSNG